MSIFLRYLVVFIFLIAIIPSCDLLEDCETCKLIKNDNGSITEGAGILYCGSELEKKKNAEPTTINNITTYWDCN